MESVSTGNEEAPCREPEHDRGENLARTNRGRGGGKNRLWSRARIRVGPGKSGPEGDPDPSLLVGVESPFGTHLTHRTAGGTDPLRSLKE